MRYSICVVSSDGASEGRSDSVLKFLILKDEAKATEETSGTSWKLQIKSLPCCLSGRDIT